MAPSDDIRRQVEHIRRWERGEDPSPLKLTLGTTYVCNLRCRFCEQLHSTAESDLEKAGREIPAERLLKLVREAAELGVETVCISGGGEPFLRPWTLEIMREIRKQGMSGGTTTNGVLLGEKAVEELVSMEWGRIDFSIDGPDMETHDFLRNLPGAFQRATDAARMLAAEKESQGKKHPIIAVATVLTNMIFDQISEMVELAVDLGAEVFTLTPLAVHHEEGNSLKLRPEHWEGFRSSVEKARAIANEHGLSTNLDSFTEKEFVFETNNMSETFLLNDNGTDVENDEAQAEGGALEGSAFFGVPCFEPWTTLVIHPDGFVDPCEKGHHVTYLGDKSLSELWFKDTKIQAMRKRFFEGELPESCAKCCGPLVSANIQIREALRTRE